MSRPQVQLLQAIADPVGSCRNQVPAETGADLRRTINLYFNAVYFARKHQLFIVGGIANEKVRRCCAS
jgi:hypothetical protein